MLPRFPVLCIRCCDYPPAFSNSINVALVKRMRKLGLVIPVSDDSRLQTLFRCLLSHPLLPANEVRPGFEDVRSMLDDQSPVKWLMEQLERYVEKQWLNKSTVGPSRLSVRDNQARTNNAVESFHASLRRRIKVPHPNLFAFLGQQMLKYIVTI